MEAAASLAVSLAWALEKTNTGFNDAKQKGSLSYNVSPAVGTYNQLFAARYTIAAAGTQAVDFYSFTNLAGESVTATKMYAVMIKVTGAGSTIVLEPHGTNGLTWFFGGTNPTITMPGSATGSLFVFSEGGTEVLSATVRKFLLTNSGGSSATVDVVAIVGT